MHNPIGLNAIVALNEKPMLEFVMNTLIQARWKAMYALLMHDEKACDTILTRSHRSNVTRSSLAGSDFACTSWERGARTVRIIKKSNSDTSQVKGD